MVGVTTGVPLHLGTHYEAIKTEGRCRLRVPMEASESRTIAILAEKPSVAQDIARVLGAVLVQTATTVRMAR
jgi:hypothetical protein